MMKGAGKPTTEVAIMHGAYIVLMINDLAATLFTLLSIRETNLKEILIVNIEMSMYSNIAIFHRIWIGV